MNSNRQSTLENLPPSTAENIEECPECESTDIVESWKDGTNVCRSCGYVVRQTLYDQGKEWRTFAEDEGNNPNRAGPSANPLLEHEEATDVGKKRVRGEGGLALTVIRARKRQRQSAASKADRTMLEAISNIDKMCDRHSLTQTISDVAKELFKKYHDYLTLKVDQSGIENMVRYRSLRASESNEIAASSLFLACRLQNAPRSFKEVYGITKVPQNIIGKQ